MRAVHPDSLDIAELEAMFRTELNNAGAVVSFTGYVRERSSDGAVRSLVLEEFPGVTEREIQNKRAEAISRWDLLDLRIAHRIGSVPAGAAIVWVGAAAVHRREAFEAVDCMMDYLKSTAFFWKKEIRDGSECWIEPTDRDYKDASRWSMDGSA